MLSRVAIVFDNTARPETTGLYVRRALGRLVSDVEHLLPHELSRPLARGYDAYIFVDDGLEYSIPTNLGPTAWWAIDTHMSYERTLQKAWAATCVFAAQQDGTLRLRSDGITAAQWLPLACDPELHRPHSVPLVHDLCFVGNVLPGARADLIADLQQVWPRMFIGQRYFQEMALIYSGSRLAFNRSVRNDVNMRVFEAVACGSLLLTNDLTSNGQELLLQDGTHLVTYRSAEELIDKVRYYLAHDDERMQIAAAGRADVHTRHTYDIRVRGILSELDRATSSVSVPGIELPDDKDSGYFEFARPEVLELVPASARRVLDIGCGSGRFGECLRQRQPCEVWGIERDPAVSRRAATRLDRVLNADIESPDIKLPDAYFDCVVCADVLEHLRHPERLLKRLHSWLVPDGCIIVSLPNIQHHSVLTSLLDGNFTYEPAGLLDEDHVRLFTRRELEKLLFRTRFQAADFKIVPGPGWKEWAESGQLDQVRIGSLAISGLDPEQAENFFAYQFLVRATRAPNPEFAVTSIIIVTHNQLHYTRQCLASIRFRTDEPYELIVVDNGSTDGTVDYLRSEREVTVIANPDNRGFPAAVNQGLQIASGQHCLLLNNDTVVTTGWLQRMLDALASDSKIGLVGPVSNSVSGPQQIPVDYRDLSSLDGFAWQWGQRHAGQLVDLDRLVGFCLLIRKEVVDQIGPLDERFGIGCFEDDDYCRRAQQAGFRTVVATDSFVHHFGSCTFRATGVDFAQLMKDNQRKYDEKWNSPTPIATPSDSKNRFRFARAPGGGLQLLPVNRVSLCMIVRDNESTIGPCLESIRPWVDEMIVVDTGSTDATPQICQDLGARVMFWAWRDDFSAARNESLRYATGDWIFWMDSDDTIPEHCGAQLRALVDGNHAAGVQGYVMQVHCPGPESENGRDVTVVDHVKLFRNRQELKFEHRIHEQVLPAIRRIGGDVVFTEMYVVHSGADHTTNGRQRKLERDFKLLKLDLAERPDHPFVLFNLGMTYADAQQLDEAAHWLTRCLQVSRHEESHVRKTYALLLSVLFQKSDHETGRDVCEAACRLFPDDKEIQFRKAMLEHQQGQWDAAARSYLRVLEPETSRQFTSVDVGLSGFKARHNLALVYEDAGKFELAEQQWITILDEHSDYRPAQIGRIDCLLRQQRLNQATEAIEALPFQNPAIPEVYRLRARLAEMDHRLPDAARELELGLQVHQDSPILLRELARMNYEVGDYVSASGLLQRLTAAAPNDATAWRNLGVVLLHLDQHSDAKVAFARAKSQPRESKPQGS